MKIVATTSLPAVNRPNADRWNAARSRQNNMVEDNKKKEDDNNKLRKTSINSVKNLILKHEKIVEKKKSNDHEGMRKFKKDDHLDAKRVNRLA